ncbi:hypothetical protein Tco_1358989 [Tanacetum coccineum]
MAQPQRPADVHRGDLCPPNKRYALMDANKNIDLDNPLYLNECKIMANIIQNLSIVASSSVPWIYLGQFWHTLQENGSKYRLKFVLDRKELTLTLNDFRRIFHLPQATNNNHERFVAAPKFLEMVPFFLNTLGKHKDGVGMKIPSWMITDEIKLTDHYRMHAVIFGVDIPMTRSQLIKSTQGTHRTPSTPRSPNPELDEVESSALRKSTVIRLRIPQRRSTRLTPPTLIPKTDEADDIILQDIIQLSLTEQKINSSTLRQDDTQIIPGTRLETRSDKESPKVEITAKVQPVNINEEEEESAEDDYEWK